MKKNFKTTGIILRKVDFNEADRIITVLTKDLGKIDLLAKKGRYFKHKFCGRLELFHEVEITALSGKGDLDYLKEIEIIKALPDIKDPDQHRLLFYLAEITHRLIQSHQNIEGVYELLKETLLYLSSPYRLEIVFHTYLIKLLSRAGFLPMWNECSDCNEKLDLNQKVYVSLDDAHLKCSYCASSVDHEIEKNRVKWIHFMQNYHFSDIFKVKLTQKECQATWLHLQKVVHHLLQYPLKSEGFLNAKA